jgi:mono/diheme cytochrome c family protein
MAHVEGSHTLPQWLVEHFNTPQAIVAGSQMRNPGLSFEETGALTTFVLSLQERDLPRSYLSPAFHKSLAEAASPPLITGEELYGRFCATCHGNGRFGSYDKFYRKFMPAVRNPAFLAVADSGFIAATTTKGRPGTLMPAWGPGSGGLSDLEIRRIAEYLREGIPSVDPARPAHAATADLTSGDWQRGAAHFKQLCTGCHGVAGVGHLAPSLANREFQANADTEFLYRTIAFGRRNTAMPAFRARDASGLSDKEIIDLVAYVTSLGQAAEASMAQNESPVQSEQVP